MEPDKRIEAFLDRIVEKVHYFPIHYKLKKEYRNHLEDHIERNILLGKNREEAIDEALVTMGNPESIGMTLNEVHRPLIGWLLTLTKWVTISLSVLMIFNLGFPLFDDLTNGSQPYYSIGFENEHHVTLEARAMNERLTVFGQEWHFSQATLDDAGNARLYFSATHINRFNPYNLSIQTVWVSLPLVEQSKVSIHWNQDGFDHYILISNLHELPDSLTLNLKTYYSILQNRTIQIGGGL